MVKDKLAEILNFFEPVQLNNFTDSSYLNDQYSLGKNLIINSIVDPLPVNSRFELAIFCVNRFLNDNHIDNPTQGIREELYRLKRISSGIRIVDLGDLKIGSNLKETQFALQEVCALLFHLKVKVVVLGGTQNLTIGCFRAFKEFENNINLINIDSRVDLSSTDELIDETDFLSEIIQGEASHLYNVSTIGYQSYFVDSKQLKRLNAIYFEHYRLGEVQANIERMEPVIRDGDLVSFDISAIRLSDAPGQNDGSPNGFFGNEACRLSRYAGLSDRVQAFGLFNVESSKGTNKQTVKLSAQIIWYFFEGYLNRKHDFPQASLEDYIKYEVQIDEIDFPIVFYKSEKTSRWWIEVQSPVNQETSGGSVVVSCIENDYLRACKNEIPERWWLNFKKLK